MVRSLPEEPAVGRRNGRRGDMWRVSEWRGEQNETRDMNGERSEVSRGTRRGRGSLGLCPFPSRHHFLSSFLGFAGACGERKERVMRREPSLSVPTRLFPSYRLRSLLSLGGAGGETSGDRSEWHVNGGPHPIPVSLSRPSIILHSRPPSFHGSGWDEDEGWRWQISYIYWNLEFIISSFSSSTS